MLRPIGGLLVGIGFLLDSADGDVLPISFFFLLRLVFLVFLVCRATSPSPVGVRMNSLNASEPTKSITQPQALPVGVVSKSRRRLQRLERLRQRVRSPCWVSDFAAFVQRCNLESRPSRNLETSLYRHACAPVAICWLELADERTGARAEPAGGRDVALRERAGAQSCDGTEVARTGE